jgi:integrase/recombinase XerD
MPPKATPLPQVGEPSDPLGLTRLVESYLEWQQVRGSSPRTVTGLHKNLRGFLRWCGERELVHPSDFNRQVIESYQRSLFYHRKRDGAPLSYVTQRGRLQTVQSFFRWLVRSNFLLFNPAAELEMPRVVRRLPAHVLTAYEVEQVMVQPDVSEPLGLRDRAILELLYATGVRRLELAGLVVYDVDHGRRVLRIQQGKGRKDRMVPIGERALLWLDKYLHDVRPGWVVDTDEQHLFLGNHGGALHPGYLTHLVRGYVKQAGIMKSGSCHLFRHSMATLMLENGADLRFIQAMLGHADLKTTQIYTQVSMKMLAAVVQRTHPASVGVRERGRASDRGGMGVFDGGGEGDGGEDADE